MSRRYIHHTPAARIPPFPRSHAPTGEVQSLDPSDIAAAAAKQKQREQDAEKSDGSSVTPDDEEEIVMDECKYTDDELLKTRTPLLTGSDVADKREEIRDYFHRTFSLYEKLFDVLVADSTFAMQPEKLRHPLIFYFGHTAVFFINKLRLAGLLSGRINEGMESTLAIGVDEMSWDDLNTGNYAWPTVAQVRAYRDMARLTVDDLISSLPLQLPITWDSPFWIILMGCEHERIHLETSSVLFRQLPIDQVKAVPMWEHCKQFRSKKEQVPPNAFITVPAGKVVAGNSQATQQYYGWDLEYGVHTAQVSSFDAAQFLCSNAEFMEFVQAGGYQDPTLWGDEGWKFVQFRKATCPVFWVPIEEESIPGDNKEAVPTPVSAVRYRYRTMTAIIDMPWDWPCDVNYIEASAFCAWKNRQRAAAGDATDGRVYRLPTESEWYRLRDHAFPEREVDEATGVTKINDQPYWPTAPGNINMEHGASSCPIDQFRFGHGFYDVIGNAWQWTETPIMPFRGFQFHPMYDDFCWGFGTQLIMMDGSFKAVQDIVKDFRAGKPQALLGEDSTPRTVKTVTAGNTGLDAFMMPGAATFRIAFAKKGFGEFTCNGGHILVLRHSGRPTLTTCQGRWYADAWILARENQVTRPRRRQVADFGAVSAETAQAAFAEWQRAHPFEPLDWTMTAQAAFEASTTEREDWCMVLPAGGVDFAPLIDTPSSARTVEARLLTALRSVNLAHLTTKVTTSEVHASAWLIGVWLAIGAESPESGCFDLVGRKAQCLLPMIEEWSRSLQDELPGVVTFTDAQGQLVQRVRIGGVLSALVDSFGLKARQRLPADLLAASRAVRLQLLAGLVDGMGSVRPATLSYTLRVPNSAVGGQSLLESIVPLARSLGFCAGAVGEDKSPGWRMQVSGVGLHAIPTRLDRVAAHPESALASWRGESIGFALSKVAHADYFGFQVDGPNKKLVLSNYVVTHNSVPTFDTRHNVFCGGSWASTGNEATRYARFAFRRHFYQHASFRYVLAEPLTDKNSPKESMCEVDPAVTAMMDAQFNDAAQAKLAASLRMMPTPNYALRIAQIAMQTYRTYGNAKMPAAQADADASGATTLTSAGPRAIDIGCACGRSTFELAKLAANPAGSPVFTHILGLDFSTRFIRIAAQLQFDQHAEYAMRREGELISYHSIESVANAPPASASATSSLDVSTSTSPSVLDLDLSRVGMQHRVEFMQGDACNLAAKYTGYDLVLAANLIEYLYAPKQFLQSIGARMRQGGVLIIASTYDWSEQFTAKAQWLGGLKDGSGESVDSSRALAETLTPDFDPLPDVTQELPMLWKQNQRNYALKFSQVTAWRKK